MRAGTTSWIMGCKVSQYAARCHVMNAESGDE